MSEQDGEGSATEDPYRALLVLAQEAYDRHGVAESACPICGRGPVVTFYYQPAGRTGGAAVACRACRQGILITRAESPAWYTGEPEPFKFKPIPPRPPPKVGRDPLAR